MERKSVAQQEGIRLKKGARSRQRLRARDCNSAHCRRAASEPRSTQTVTAAVS